MAHISYDIVHRNGGWCIVCGDVVGPPYNRRTEAEKDATFIAALLEKGGDRVTVAVEGLPLRA